MSNPSFCISLIEKVQRGGWEVYVSLCACCGHSWDAESAWEPEELQYCKCFSKGSELVKIMFYILFLWWTHFLLRLVFVFHVCQVYLARKNKNRKRRSKIARFYDTKYFAVWISIVQFSWMNSNIFGCVIFSCCVFTTFLTALVLSSF